jgi:hypothetical protein
MSNATHLRRFDIALSYPGEQRTFVEQVAKHLADTFSETRVLYDKYHDAEFARVDLDVYLPNLYRTQSELLVVFLCAEYAAKRWCNLEWRAIRQLIATLEADRIMLLSFGDPGDLSQLGILAGDGYINIGVQSAAVIAEKIRKRLNLNQGIIPQAPATTVHADISRIIKYAPAELIGRENELQLLNDAWVGNPQSAIRNPQSCRPHIVTFVALGGEGKTSLVAKWAAELAANGWPGCDAVFAWSFYSQGTREQVAASSDLFLKAALDFLGDDDDQAFAASAAGAYEKGERLARVVARRRCLLILDGLEPLQYAPSAPTPGELKDQGVAALLKKLAADNRGLCVVTTRYALPDLRAFLNQTVREEPLLRLSRAAGVHLLKTLGVRGSELRNLPLKDGDAQSEQVNEFEKLVEDVKGHALTLTLLGGFLRRAYHGDIRQRDRVQFTKADEKMDGGHALRTMAVYEQWLLRDGGDEGRREVAVLRLLGLFDRPAEAGCLAALRREPVIPDLTEPLVGLAAEDWEFALSGLEAALLLTVTRDAAGALVALDAHPHLREYFAKRLKEGMKDEVGRMKEGEASSLTPHPSSFQLAHRRLYEYLCENTKEGDQPTLEDLQPLYQAVAHGCQAGLQQEACDDVYFMRTLRGNEYFSLRKLGAFGSDLGAVACFFEQAWTRVSTEVSESDQSWLLGAAATRLRALGRLIESLEPMRAGLKMRIKQENWKPAAVSANNLSELDLMLGEVAGAVEDAEQSVSYADRSGDAFQRVARRTTHADALHQAGRLAEAEARFREAKQMQAERQPNYPLLYSLPGFKYCDLLLAPCERAAWGKAEGGRQKDEWIAACRTVSHRAAQTLKWVESWQKDILSAALDHLTLGRAAFYEALLAGTSLETCRASLNQAVSGLRRAGQQDYLPRGLLTRAWFRSRSGVPTGPDSAQTDLDEAWEIASRGPMRLHMADIHLYRARLFGGVRDEGGGMKEPYPWESVEHDLAEAERLIKECGYYRRDEELADAKRMLLG